MRRPFPTLHVRPRPRRRVARLSAPLLVAWGFIIGLGVPLALLRAFTIYGG